MRKNVFTRFAINLRYPVVLTMLIFMILTLTSCQAGLQSSGDIKGSDTDILFKWLEAIPSLLVSIVLGVFGVIATHIYKRSELALSRAETIQKFIDHVLNTENKQGDDNSMVQATLTTISTLGDKKVAVKLAELLATQKEGALIALDRFSSSSDRNLSRQAKKALNSLMDVPHFWEMKTGSMLTRVKAYKIISDVAKGKQYSKDEISNVFSEVCKSDKKRKIRMGDQIGLCLNTYRMEAIYRLLDTAHWHPIWRGRREKDIRKEFENMIPLFEVIVRINQGSEKLHRDYAHLAYVYKDKPNPDWDQAGTYIDKAIQSLGKVRKKSYSDEHALAIYQVNKILVYMDCNEKRTPDPDVEISRIIRKGSAELLHLLDNPNQILMRGWKNLEDAESNYPLSAIAIKQLRDRVAIADKR